MKVKNFFISLASILVLTDCFKCSVAQQNPVIDKNFPDPTVIEYGGVYYAYATQGMLDGKMLNIQIAKSKDLKSWKIVGDAMPTKPNWAHTTQDFWAPHVLFDKPTQQFVLFYSAKADDDTYDKCMGVAFSKNPEGPFVDMGKPLITGEGFVNIDPYAINDNKTGKNYLFWGSGFEPLKVQEMASDWKSFAEKSEPKLLVWPGKEKKYDILIEGSWIDYNQGYYYLYYSGDNCCGLTASYAVLVARSKNLTGPYTTMADEKGVKSSAILESYGDWIAPGHNSVFKDKRGKNWIAYHAIKKTELSKEPQERLMCISPLFYKNGWPVVKVQDDIKGK